MDRRLLTALVAWAAAATYVIVSQSAMASSGAAASVGTLLGH